MNPAAAAPLDIHAALEVWPIAGAFRIARGAKTQADVVVATVRDPVSGKVGRGECVPYPRYGETPQQTIAAIEALCGRLMASATADDDPRLELQGLLPASAARNALDCALWDLSAKRRGRPVHALAGLPPPRPALTCYTLSLDTPEAMAAKARAVSHLPLLKLKLGAAGDDAARMRAVRAARPDARLVADANEGWQANDVAQLLAVAREVGFEMVEQPLPAGADAPLRDRPRDVPVCADEAAHTAEGLAGLADRYDAVNVKLDKTGGLTGAIEMVRGARAAGFKVMVGSMVATSLAVAPALLLAPLADWVDLDGPLLLAADRTYAIAIENGVLQPAAPALWG